MRFVGLLTAAVVLTRPVFGQVIDSAVAVPMRDGVVLRAIVMRPAGPGRFPVLVYRTPYGAASAITSYTTFRRAVDRGYAVVAQDVRGRYRSDGEFNPYRQEGHDGYDTIEWAAAQPWSTGAVGTFGLSYPGAVQWLAAVESPPHLKAMVPAMTFSSARNFWFAGGLPDLSWPSWILLNIGPDARRRKNLAGPATYPEANAWWVAHGDELIQRLPISNVPEVFEVAPWYREWLAHPADDPWWDWADLTNKYGRVKAAVLNVSGWHDDNYGPEGAITNHLGLLATRRGEADPRSRIIIGPWVHGVAGMINRTAQAKSGERIFGATAGIDYDGEILGFMDRYVRGVAAGPDSTPRVRAFVMGENAWRTAERWPLPGTTSRTLNFNGASRAGSLDWSAAPAGTRTITSDPSRPLIDPTKGSGAHDYRWLAERTDAMVFETAPLDTDLRVVGNIKADLFIRTDAPDIDVWVRLFDVLPDGTAWNLMSPGLDVVRMSYRRGRRALLRPGRTEEVILPNLMTGNLFLKGHRIRAVVTTSFLPYFGRNLQTGKLETESKETRPATFTVLSGPRTPSRLILPVIP